MKIEERLDKLGIHLPDAPNPAGNYVPTIRSGNQLLTAGMLPMESGKVKYQGKLGSDLTIEQGQEAAHLCGLNILAAAKQASGSLDNISRVLSLSVFVNGLSDFNSSPLVANAVSDLMVEVFGEKGKHVRAAVTVACLPLDAAVEVQATFELL